VPKPSAVHAAISFLHKGRARWLPRRRPLKLIGYIWSYLASRTGPCQAAMCGTLVPATHVPTCGSGLMRLCWCREAGEPVCCVGRRFCLPRKPRAFWVLGFGFKSLKQ
jgi:hypothetical protein